MLRVSHKCNSLRLFPRLSFLGAVITNENSVLVYCSKTLKSFVFIAMYIIEMLTNLHLTNLQTLFAESKLMIAYNSTEILEGRLNIMSNNSLVIRS